MKYQIHIIADSPEKAIHSEGMPKVGDNYSVTEVKVTPIIGLENVWEVTITLGKKIN